MMMVKDVAAAINGIPGVKFWSMYIGSLAGSIGISVGVTLFLFSWHGKTPHEDAMPRAEIKMITDRIERMDRKLDKVIAQASAIRYPGTSP